MNRRRFLLLALVLLLVATFFLPPVYWRVVGWVNGESFYQGRPTSYWEREVRSHYFPLRSKMWSPPSPPRWIRQEIPMWNRYLPAEYQQATRFESNPLLLNGDAEAIPVLVELLHRSNPYVRWLAVMGIGQLGPSAECTLPELEEALDDPDFDIRFTAQWARGRIEGKVKE